MPSSRAIIVLGMHRSGTSVLTRGLQSLGVYLGDNFLDSQPDNPTGYWENKGIVDLNERLLGVLGMHWETISLIDPAAWHKPEVQALCDDAAAYLKSQFLQHTLWGFKDPRTIRLLPFWRAVFQRVGVEEGYVVAIRNPLGVANSLLKRQNYSSAKSHGMSLVYLVPYLHEIAGRPAVVTDYDLFVTDPRAQLTRVACVLNIPLGEKELAAIEDFSSHFLDPNLRHSHFTRYDFDAIPDVSPLIRQAYLLLYQLAVDEVTPGAPEFWAKWKQLRENVEALIPCGVSPDERAPANPS